MQSSLDEMPTLTLLLEPTEPEMSPLLAEIAAKTAQQRRDSVPLTTEDVSMLYSLGCSMSPTTAPTEKLDNQPIVWTGVGIKVKRRVKKKRMVKREVVRKCCCCGDGTCEIGPFNEIIEYEEVEEDE